MRRLFVMLLCIVMLCSSLTIACADDLGKGAIELSNESSVFAGEVENENASAGKDEWDNTDVAEWQPADDDETIVFVTESATNEVYYATTYNTPGYWTIIANGNKWQIPLVDANGKTISGTVTSCSSSDTSIATVKVENGQCIATSKKAGFVTIHVYTSSIHAIYTVISQFKDVTNQNKSYWTPVYWALNNNITTGTSNTTFSPDGSCTRAQIVTFIYRYFGSPNVPSSTENPFKDINSSKYYYKAVLWAVESGITTGTSATTFSPDKACTRAQCVTFLWRALGCPEPSSTNSPFTDVTNPNASYYKAVLFALEYGITTGTSSTTFSPNKTCTRAQVVTFLWRLNELLLQLEQ